MEARGKIYTNEKNVGKTSSKNKSTENVSRNGRTAERAGGGCKKYANEEENFRGCFPVCACIYIHIYFVVVCARPSIKRELTTDWSTNLGAAARQGVGVRRCSTHSTGNGEKAPPTLSRRPFAPCHPPLGSLRRCKRTEALEIAVCIPDLKSHVYW